MTFLYDLWHESEEESHDKCVDVRTIDVGIGHDYNLVVAQFVDVSLLCIVAINAKSHSDSLENDAYRLRFEHLMPLHFLHVKNLTTEWEYGLCVAITSLLSRATSGITLDEEYLSLLRVATRAVSELTWESSTSHRILTLHVFTCLASSDSGSSGEDNLLTYLLCFVRMLFEIVGESFAYSLLNGSCHFGVSELCLGLTFKLRFSNLDTDDSSDAFTEVFARYFYLCLFDLLCESRLIVGIRLECACESGAESLEVSTAFDGVDIIDVGVDVLAVVSIIHDSDLDRHTVFLCLEVDDVIEEVGAVTIDVSHELFESVFSVEYLNLWFPVFWDIAVFIELRTEVSERDFDSGVEESELTHTTCYDVVFVCCGGEYCAIRPELLACASLISITYDFYRVERLSLFVFLLVDFTIAEHLREHVCREGVYATDAYSVKTAADFVRTFVELTSGM